LYRFDPRRAALGQPALVLDAGEPTSTLAQYMRNETRFRMVEREDPARYQRLLQQTELEIRERWSVLRRLAEPSTAPVNG
jgi:pyruvate-ferredoxin/flavodoxin oxidoreductase